MTFEAPGAVAVTGASGFVGAAVASAFADAGWAVRALVHSRLLDPALTERGVASVQGSLDDARSLAGFLEGADAVVHCAGLIKARRPQDFDRVNRGGARALFDAAAAASPAPRMLLMSSLAAREPALSGYARSKLDAEAELMEVGARTGLGWDALRPPAVYGPGDPETLKLLKWIGRGLAPVPAGPAARVSMIHVADLAAATLAWAQAPATTATVYEIDDGWPGGRSWREVVAAAGAAMGARPVVVVAPRGLVVAGAAAYEGLARALGRTPMVTAGKARELCWPDWRCTPEAFRERFGWSPSRDLESGLRETLDWYRKAGWL